MCNCIFKIVALQLTQTQSNVFAKPSVVSSMMPDVKKTTEKSFEYINSIAVVSFKRRQTPTASHLTPLYKKNKKKQNCQTKRHIRHLELCKIQNNAVTMVVKSTRTKLQDVATNELTLKRDGGPKYPAVKTPVSIFTRLRVFFSCIKDFELN